ncbi:tRNA (adenosine(37)-N6)-threonylcarbamoyltransferase complex dimerization subunit type 1 TsaB [Salidesulfovibrio brasiliensis]|uniref:tRNA (adenosine(37)-N6)-threonylcarbamoyltransferase complex dimerization subunit type 1 TsaB n=1 Tax=Salidesulfovibrio brasiliensis TaxID=221711 RepID=UPI0009FB4922|nr:tRNA (adenosine(37)-N6)-threonylcarbamoyltransferase complex dimerization subunit type 1 TsaB [Salidesulfovibrio brasiliensis]
MTSADCSPDTKPVLALNCCEERLQMVLGTEDASSPQVLASAEWTVPGRAVGFIAPGIQSMLSALGLKPGDIGGVACVRGPGSFTGLRLILAAAAGFAAGVNIPTTGLDYLPLLAGQAATVHEGSILVVTYARRGQVYLQHFRQGTALGPTEAMRATDAVESIRKNAVNSAVLGSGLRKNPGVFDVLAEEGHKLLPPAFDNPSSTALLEAALNATFDFEDIRPRYIRMSDAEENLETFAAKRGLSPEEARKRLHDYE